MKTKEKISANNFPKGYVRMGRAMEEKYAHLDLFREKFDRDNEFIRRVGLPDFMKSK
jgi:hypothetical protein